MIITIVFDDEVPIPRLRQVLHSVNDVLFALGFDNPEAMVLLTEGGS